MTNVNKEMTIANKFNALADYCIANGVTIDGFDVVEFLQDRAEKSVNKSSSKANEKKIAENKALADLIAKAIDTIGRPCRVGEIVTCPVMLECDTPISSNKITSVMTKTNADMFVKSVEKGVSYYTVA